MRDAGRKGLPRVTLDTNVLVSALISPGTSRRILELARGGSVTLILSPFILEETADVLRGKMGWGEGMIRNALDAIQTFADLVRPEETLYVVAADEQDNRIVECAVSGQADFLVSGDKHILSLLEYRGVRFLSPRDLLEILRRK